MGTALRKARYEPGTGPSFSQAAAFANAVAEGKTASAEDIFVWEHGVALEPWPEAVDGRALLNDLKNVIVRYVQLPKWASCRAIQQRKAIWRTI